MNQKPLRLSARLVLARERGYSLLEMSLAVGAIAVIAVHRIYRFYRHTNDRQSDPRNERNQRALKCSSTVSIVFRTRGSVHEHDERQSPRRQRLSRRRYDPKRQQRHQRLRTISNDRSDRLRCRRADGLHHTDAGGVPRTHGEFHRQSGYHGDHGHG